MESLSSNEPSHPSNKKLQCAYLFWLDLEIWNKSEFFVPHLHHHSLRRFQNIMSVRVLRQSFYVSSSCWSFFFKNAGQLFEWNRNMPLRLIKERDRMPFFCHPKDEFLKGGYYVCENVCFFQLTTKNLHSIFESTFFFLFSSSFFWIVICMSVVMVICQ